MLEYNCCVLASSVDRSVKRRQVKPLAASLLDALDYDSSDDSDFEVGDSSGKILQISLHLHNNEGYMLVRPSRFT